MTIPAALTGGVTLLERAMAYTLGSLVRVTPEAMTHPTPCRRWDLQALLLHMNDSLLALGEAVTAGRVTVFAGPAGEGGARSAGGVGGEARAAEIGGAAPDLGDPLLDPVGTLQSRACWLLGAWVNIHAPGPVALADQSLTPDITAAVGGLEITVHGWDVAVACGAVRPVPPSLAEELLELAPLLITAADRPSRFAAPVPVLPGADPSDRLLAFLGRHPV